MTQNKRGSAATRKGAERRAAIIAAAAGLFAEEGYRGASLASVASKVGLTQPGLLHYFPSKEALLLAVCEDRYHLDGQRLLGRVRDEGFPLLEALQDIVEHNQQSVDAVKLFAVLVAESISEDHPAHDHFTLRYAKVRARLERILRTAQDDGTIRPDIDLTLLVPVIVAVMDGLQTQWLLDQQVDMAASFALFSSLLGAALSSSEPAEENDAGEPSVTALRPVS